MHNGSLVTAVSASWINRDVTHQRGWQRHWNGLHGQRASRGGLTPDFRNASARGSDIPDLFYWTSTITFAKWSLRVMTHGFSISTARYGKERPQAGSSIGLFDPQTDGFSRRTPKILRLTKSRHAWHVGRYERTLGSMTCFHGEYSGEQMLSRSPLETPSRASMQVVTGINPATDMAGHILQEASNRAHGSVKLSNTSVVTDAMCPAPHRHGGWIGSIKPGATIVAQHMSRSNLVMAG